MNNLTNRSTNRLTILLLCGAAIITLANFSGQNSTEKKGFKTNYIGTINGNQVENITISGQIDNIKFYSKPEKIDASPETGYTKSSLNQLKQITIPAGAKKSKYGTKTYIDTQVTFKDGSNGEFIVETTRMAAGEKKDKTGTIERFFDENGLKTLEIQSVECNG